MRRGGSLASQVIGIYLLVWRILMSSRTGQICRMRQSRWCHYYRISINPHKCQFWVKHKVILGHIVSRNGISTDEGKVKLILELSPPKNYKDFNASWATSVTTVASYCFLLLRLIVLCTSFSLNLSGAMHAKNLMRKSKEPLHRPPYLNNQNGT